MIDTDYSSYAIVYSCDTVIKDFIKYEAVWFLSRSPLASNELLNKVTDIITKRLPRYN